MCSEAWRRRRQHRDYFSLRLAIRQSFAGGGGANCPRRGAGARAAILVIEQIPEFRSHTILLFPSTSQGGGLVEIENCMIAVHNHNQSGDKVKHFGNLSVVQGCMAIFPAPNRRNRGVIYAGNGNRVCL